MPEQDHQHQSAGDDPEEGGHPQLLQEVEARQELPVVHRAKDQQDDDEAECNENRAIQDP